ncbi:sugar-binding protein [Desulfuromonas acetoxidans]|uniref:sugar-binding protein n=1 Tax=Desulfuromonas acetoxidans TaxID=891 RepID=UPI00292FAB8E|nr:sugar-binding protein [Desulfuromonas acetoxidans]
MNLVKGLPNLLWLCILITLLTACSNSSSHRATTEATTLPFGAEEVTAETDYDGDGHWDTRTTYSFVYNEDLQVTEATIIYEDDDNADGIADSRTTETYVYDPTIEAEDITIRRAVQKGAAPSNNSAFGALISQTSVNYRSDEISGEIAEYPYSRREYTYTYSPEGKLLSYSYTRFYYNESDGTLSESNSTTTTNTYDEDGKTIGGSLYDTTDNNGDGILDDSQSSVCTITYDSNGYLTSQSCVTTSDDDGDGPTEATETVSDTTYTHTYTDGVLTQTIVEGGDEIVNTPYTLDFTYNEDGLVATKTKSYNNYGESGIDTYYRLSFSYDSEGRVIGYTNRFEYDSNDDEVLDYFEERIYTFSYDDNARILTSNYQYRDDSTPTVEGYNNNYLYTHTYSYTEDGLLSSYDRTYQTDLDRDGEVDNVSYTRNIEYTYENGYLASLNYDYESTGDDEVIDSQDHETQVFTYQDGLLKTIVWEDDDNNDGAIDEATTIEATYDASGRVTAYEAINYDGDYASLDEAQAVALTYNADDTVTGTITMTSYGEGDPEVTTTPVNIDFSANGLPSGGMDYTFDTIEPDYCVTPSTETLLYYHGDNYIKEQTYLINIKIPKILGIMWMVSMSDS